MNPLLASDSSVFSNHVKNLPYAHGGVVGDATMRDKAGDFNVVEQLSFEPSGEGEHVFLQLRKTGLNTDSVAQTLAKFANVKRRDVAYAGMKDRHAITTQTFSVYLPGKQSPNWALLEDESLNIVSETRHLKKLRKGAISNNQFTITLNNCRLDSERLLDVVELIGRAGVPNYFMEQRFGFNGHNLELAHRVFSEGEAFKSKRIKGLLLSAVRSFLFNKVLAHRVDGGSWGQPLLGDAFILNGTRQFFIEKSIDSTIVRRVNEHDIHPSGPLYGVGESTVFAEVQKIESDVFDGNEVFCDGLLREKVEFSRRPLRVVPQNMKVEKLAEQTVKLSFTLPSGSYATAVIRELFETTSNRD